LKFFVCCKIFTTLHVFKLNFAMGIGFNEAQRALILGSSKLPADRAIPADAIVIDGPCAFRKYMSRTCSARFVAQQVWKTIVKQFPGATAISVHFDIATMLPPERTSVGVARASKAPDLTDEERQRVVNLGLSEKSPGHIEAEIPWDLVLRWGGKQKQNAWRIMAESIWAVVVAGTSADLQVVSEQFSATRGGTFGGEFAKEQIREKWGEADLMVAACSQRLARKGLATVVVTIDYDMVLQTLCYYKAGLPGSILLKFARELVSATNLLAMYGDVNSRLTSALFLLTAFKSDYSKSACRQAGMTTKGLIKEMQTKRGPTGLKQWCIVAGTDEAGNRTLTFMPAAYRRALKKLPDIASIQKHLWTIAYFAGYDGGREPAGGPPAVVLPSSLFIARTPVVFASEVHGV
jgi:hypothetical protein